MWAWLRKKLRAMDLADLKAGRPPVTKEQLKDRVRGIFATNKAQEVAMNKTRHLRTVCQRVVANRGAAV